MLTFFIYLSFVYLFIYIYILYIFICVFIHLFIYLFIIQVYNFYFFVMLFILLFFFDMVNFIYVMSICVCVNRTIDGDLQVVLHGSNFWANWHHCILYKTCHSSLPEKEHN